MLHWEVKNHKLVFGRLPWPQGHDISVLQRFWTHPCEKTHEQRSTNTFNRPSSRQPINEQSLRLWGKRNATMLLTTFLQAQELIYNTASRHPISFWYFLSFACLVNPNWKYDKGIKKATGMIMHLYKKNILERNKLTVLTYMKSSPRQNWHLSEQCQNSPALLGPTSCDTGCREARHTW